MLHAGPHHGGEQRKRAADVVGEVELRLAHRFAHRDERREVDHRLAPHLAHQFRQRVGVGDVQLVAAAPAGTLWR